MKVKDYINYLKTFDPEMDILDCDAASSHFYTTLQYDFNDIKINRDQTYYSNVLNVEDYKFNMFLLTHDGEENINIYSEISIDNDAWMIPENLIMGMTKDKQRIFGPECYHETSVNIDKCIVLTTYPTRYIRLCCKGDGSLRDVLFYGTNSGTTLDEVMRNYLWEYYKEK